MKLTKYRLHKIINKCRKQSRKKFNTNLKLLKHHNTCRNKKYFNLHNRSLKCVK
jgi:hypothetical protein